MKDSPLGRGCKTKFLKYFSLSMAITLLSSLNEGIMGLVEKHSVYSKPLICFSMRIPILSNFGILRNIYGVVLCATLLPLK